MTTVRLGFRDPFGSARSGEFTIDGEPVTGAAGVATRAVRDGDGHPLLQRYLPVGSVTPERLWLLDNEIRATTRFAQCFGQQHPPELPWLVGYDTSAAEPYLLLGGYAGAPLSSLPGRLDRAEQRALRIGLFTALTHTAAAGVVHGDVGPDTLLWDGRTVRLVDFGQATATGWNRHRSSSPAGPRRSPEQLAGTGPADPRDDVWAAAVVVRQQAGVPDGVSGGSMAVRKLLRGAGEPLDRRPRAAEVLRRLDVTVEPRPGEHAARLAAGHSRFDEVCADKRARATARKPARRSPAPVLVLLVVVVVLLVVVLIAVAAG